MEQFDTQARTRVTAYTSSLIVALASFVFLTVVPFVPDPPFIPLLVAVVLATLSLKNRGGSVTLLYLLVFGAVLWQLIGFGFFQLLTARVGFAVLAALILPLFVFVSKRIDLTSLPLGILCVSLMFTPAYFVSIPIIAAAAAVTGFASLEAISAVFILFLAPFLLLDNALLFVTSSQASAPIIFGPLVYLSSNLRPSLPGLNVFLTPIPSDYISPQAPAVSTFLINDWALLVIPLLLMGAIILVSSFLGGVVRSLLGKVSRFRGSKRLSHVGTPLVVSLVVPASFVALLVPFSLPGAGGFQTSLTSGASLVHVPLMLAASALLCGVFIARESLLKRMEGVELRRENVDRLVKRSRSSIDVLSAELKEVARMVPWLDVSGEEKALSEYSSYLDDVEKRLPFSGAYSLVDWADHIEKEILSSLGRSKEVITREVLGELKALGAAIETANTHLEEASVRLRYSQVPPATFDVSLEQTVGLYLKAAAEVEAETQLIFEAFRSAIEAFDRLMNVRGSAAPAGPAPLLVSHDYAAATKLVSEEYWLKFHAGHSQELQVAKGHLLEQLERLKEIFTAEQAKQLGAVMESIKWGEPADSVALLGKVEETRAILASLLRLLEERPRVIEKTVGSIGPQVVKMVQFETLRRAGEIAPLKKALDSTGTVIADLTKYVRGAIPALTNLVAAWEADEEKLLLLAHYPTARNVIRTVMSERRRVRVEALPYGDVAAALYARIYASENPKTKFDEGEEVLSSVA